MVLKNKNYAFWVYVLLILSLSITFLYYSSESSGVAETKWKLTTWMHGSIPAIVASVLTLATVSFQLIRKRSVVITASEQLYAYSVAIILFFLFNPWAVVNIAQLPLSITLSTAFYFLSYAIFGRLTYAIWPPVFFLSLITYAATFQGIRLDPDKLAQIFCASWQDAKSYFTYGNICLLICGSLVSIAAWYAMQRKLSRIKRSILFSHGLMLLTPALFLMLLLKSNIAVNEKYIWPLGNSQTLAVNSKNTIFSIRHINYMIDLLPKEDVNATISPSVQYNGIVCILHVGESVSSNHCHINGYERNTTPWLSQQKTLINFKDCIASAIVTDRALITIVTNGRRDFLSETSPQYKPSSPCLVDFFKASGFTCATFWDACYLKSSSNDLFTRQVEYFNRKADAVYGSSATNYMEQVPMARDFLKKHNGKNVFLMINNFGSHAFYNGYDSNCPPFPIETPPRADLRPSSNVKHAEIVTNAYDSTIHLTDRYIESIAEYLKGKPFIYIYISDHGEYLGDHGYWQRSQVPFSQFHQHEPCKVPFIIYASPELEAAHPHFKAALEQLRKNQHISTAHEHVFHTILGIMSIETPYYDQKLDLSTDAVVPYTGPHPARGGNDSL